MTDTDDVPVRAMATEERLLADSMYQAILDSSRRSLRSEQSANFKAGISDLGYCSERTRRMLNAETPDDMDALKMFIGTCLGDGMEQAWKLQHPDSIIQAEVTLDLPGEVDGQQVIYTIIGHPDIIDPQGILIDNKSARGLNLARREGATQSKQFQRHCYALASWKAGLFDPDVALEDIQVANIWIDRGGDDQELHCQMEPYNPDIVRGAAEWLNEVVYAFTHNHEARKEPAREICLSTCGFAQECRALDTDVTGLLTDPAVLAAVDMYQEGLALEKVGKKLKDEAKSGLRGVAGSTGTFAVRWVHVNESEVQPGWRRGYDKLDIKKVK